MLKRYSQILVAILVATDLLGTTLAWALAYVFRFHFPLMPLSRGVPPIGEHLQVLPLALILAGIVFRVFGLYVPRRTGSIRDESIDILRAGTALCLLLFASASFLAGYVYSRGALVLFFILLLAYLVGSRIVLRLSLREARRRGRNLRHAIIVGSGALGQKLAESLHRSAWTGIRVVGFVEDDPDRLGMVFHGIPVIGGIGELPNLVETRHVDQVYVALPFGKQDRFQQVSDALAEATVDLSLAPDLRSVDTLNLSVSVLEGMPLLTIRESPMLGWNRLAKRLLDVAVSIVAIGLTGVPMMIIAILIRRTSPGPVFYVQERMGIDGRTFRMLKFRTMPIDAEQQTGPVWARPGDPRKTPLGSFLRRTSLDELPQFFNVLLGEMSVVGPRPERPFFIEKFRKEIPRYMLRHKMKAGITGWAQVNGWRGDTSLRKRIQYDLHYIENWSVGFDLWIIWLTFLRGFVNRNAY